MYDTYHVVFEKTLRSGMDPMKALSATRIYETVLDALPQAFFQACVLVQLKDLDRGYLLWWSLLFSALSVSFIASVLEIDIDTSSDYRQLFERVHG